MSRTYRRKSGDSHGKKYYVFYEIRYSDFLKASEWLPRDKNTKEFKYRLAKYHADGGRYRNGCRGPMWWIREFCQKPYKTRVRKEIHKFLTNNEYEIIIPSKPKRDYWD